QIEEVPTEEVHVESVAEEVELQYKGALSRLGGALIDFIIIGIISFLIRLTIARVVDLPAEIVIIYGLIYFVGFWAWRGQTPGKMLTGAKIVMTDGSPVGFVRALIRYLFYLFPLFTPIMFFGARSVAALLIILPLIALFIIVFNRKKRGLYDFIAGTCVINTRFSGINPSVEDESEIEESSDTDETGGGKES
ncbi:MAG: RDD family protein, partial [Chloroflexi bacterium]|nr:RDD family protein [Chloroflexota bacterium]